MRVIKRYLLTCDGIIWFVVGFGWVAFVCIFGMVVAWGNVRS